MLQSPLRQRAKNLISSNTKAGRIPLFIIMGRIDPVEYVGVSQQRNEDVRNRCGCATFVCDEIYTRSGKADIMHDKLSVKEL